MHCLLKIPSIRGRYVVAVALGAVTDSLLITLLMRFAEKASRTIHLLLPGDYRTYPATIVYAYEVFRESTLLMPNVHVIELRDCRYFETNKILELCSTISCDLFLCSHSESDSEISLSSRSEDMEIGEQRLPGYPKPEMANNLTSSKLHCEKLGVLGCAVHALALNSHEAVDPTPSSFQPSTMLILHGPTVARRRLNATNNDLTTITLSQD